MPILEQPTWKSFSKNVSFPSLKGEGAAEVIVIGGGLAGILTAYSLSKSGKDVAVLEMDKVGSGATEYTTAFITQGIDTDLVDLIKMFGSQKAKLVRQSHGEAINFIEDIIRTEKIDCEFVRCSSFIYTISKNGLKDLEKEVATAQELGFRSSINKSKLNFKNYGIMETKNQAKFHPLKFLYKLASVVSKNARIYEQSEVIKIERPGGKGDWKVFTKNGSLTAPNVVVATYMPFNNPKQTYFKKGMYASYVFEAKLTKNSISEGIYWDDDNPYNYFRIDSQNGKYDRMIIGGQDHRKEVKMNSEKNYKALEEYMKETFSGLKYEITRRWRGPILEPSDGLALIGETYPKQYVATAFSGNGMTYSAISAMLLTDLILGKKNVWARIYDPKRVPSLYQLLKKGKDYTGEFFGGAAANILKRTKKKP
ncbi:MAG: FAD-binding oxidoreductase [Candidatus Doudnabacteria bacterium]|nr:FAD-binding oxidoreductase [Candidatus Doudnabacteria bacterium]